MTNNKPTSELGVSLVELLVVLVILAVLTTFAIIGLGKATKDLERQNIAKNFKISLERARFDSVKRRASDCENRSRVEITSATSFTLLTDSNENGVVEPKSETNTITFGKGDNVSIVADHVITYPVIIRFDQRGNASSGPCSAETEVDTPTIFCTMPCTVASNGATNSNIIFVSKTGVVAFMDGGSATPVFKAPAVASLDIANQINPLLAVWDAPPILTPTPTPTPITTPTPSSATTPTATATPTATPTTTPTATATPTPTSTATPSSTATPTPTPTATPRWCILGEQPAVVHCICSPTQYLQAGSGKCRSL